MQKKHEFTVIKGGGAPKTSFGGYRFISGFVTDTRLMGVLVLYIHWIQESSEENLDYHQFFYFDAEEYGLETFRSYTGTDETAHDLIEQTLLGGLGGKKISVTEREARFLVQSFVTASAALNVPLADPKSEYEFLLSPPLLLFGKEKTALYEKICTTIHSDYELVHYFLMRCFAGDKEGAHYLAIDGLLLDEIVPATASTLCKNVIDEYRDEDGKDSFLCEALVETDGKYTLYVLELTITEGKISSVSKRSSFRVTSAEAAMLLNRPEFITVYEILTDPNDFDDHFLPLTKEAMMTAHDNGRLFLEFHKDNNHVNQKIFRLNEDISGLYYVSDFGQLLLAAYTLEEIKVLEKVLTKSHLHSSLLPTAKYEFKEPVLYEFIQSDYEDFSDFLDSLK